VIRGSWLRHPRLVVARSAAGGCVIRGWWFRHPRAVLQIGYSTHGFSPENGAEKAAAILAFDGLPRSVAPG
jgi:hypothetical protein